ncbi:alpha/beta fold hydrolase [Zhongshania sp.]|uniref:alpha/beta fold hydrolase n=1 Tax=Zhongshania sp. TaxID=1971902 RepID=UPI0035645297
MTEPREPASKHFVSQGLKLHYLDWGNAEAPLLIFVHGMHDHARSWDHIARHMCKDWHVIAVDLRGHGDSQWSAEGLYHNPLLLLDFANLIDALGAAQVTIVAHSLGGNPSARYTALYPQRVNKLVLVDAMGPSANVIEQWNNEGVVSRSRAWLEKQKYLATRPPRRFANLAEATARMAKANAHLSAEQAEYLTRYGVREYSDGFGWKYDPATGNFLPEDFEIDLAEYWRQITAPTLLCWGPESWTSNPATDGRGAHFQNHRTLSFDKSGHWIHHDQPELFIAALHEFLAEK